jgi:hypothetical protein
MKVAFYAAVASLLVIFAAHAAVPTAAGPLATVKPLTACNAGYAQKTSYSDTVGMAADPVLCPQFLSTMIMKLPHRDQRT